MFRTSDDYAPGEPSLPGFIDWLRSKDPKEHYNWPDSGRCACGQYARHLGVANWNSGGRHHQVWDRLNQIAGDHAGPQDRPREHGWNFGDCLERAERELEKVA